MRDGLALAGGLARVGWALAREPRRDAATGMGLPRSIESLDTSWLTRALQRAFPGLRVNRFEHLDGHAGTTSRARLGLCSGGRGSGPEPPPSVFVKLPPPDVKTRMFCGLMGLGATEVRFYSEIAPDLPSSVMIPRAYYAAIGPNRQHFVLVLEDLVSPDCEFTDASHPVTAERARAVMGTLAVLHAAFWNSPRLREDLSWLRRPDHNPNLPVERVICSAGVRRAIARFTDLIPPAVARAAPRIVTARDWMELAWGAGDRTLIHGDSHIGNLFFRGDRVGFLDWQVTQCGQGMRDVTYFLINSVPTAVRRAHERHLIAHYLAALSDQGVNAPAFEAAWAQYRLHAFYPWIAAAVAAAASSLQQTAIVRASLARASMALVDLEALDLLPAGE